MLITLHELIQTTEPIGWRTFQHLITLTSLRTWKSKIDSQMSAESNSSCFTFTNCVIIRWETLSPSVLSWCLIRNPIPLIPLVAIGIWKKSTITIMEMYWHILGQQERMYNVGEQQRRRDCRKTFWYHFHFEQTFTGCMTMMSFISLWLCICTANRSRCSIIGMLFCNFTLLWLFLGLAPPLVNTRFQPRNC